MNPLEDKKVVISHVFHLSIKFPCISRVLRKDLSSADLSSQSSHFHNLPIDVAHVREAYTGGVWLFGINVVEASLSDHVLIGNL